MSKHAGFKSRFNQDRLSQSIETIVYDQTRLLVYVDGSAT